MKENKFPLIKRMKLFLKLNNTSEKSYRNNTNAINRKYINFTEEMEEKYLKERNIPIIFDFIDFDNYCCEYLERVIKERG